MEMSVNVTGFRKMWGN